MSSLSSATDVRIGHAINRKVKVKLETGTFYKIDLIGAGKLDTFLRLEDAAANGRGLD
jgi:hypothetical protein